VAEGDPSIADDSVGSLFESDQLGVLAFHIPSTVVVGAVTARISHPISGKLPIAVYSDTGERLSQVGISTSEGGPSSTVLPQPVTLQAGCYKLAWASPAADPRVWAFRIGREKRDALNSGGGAVIVGMGRGRKPFTLPERLGEVSEPPEAFGTVPLILLKG